MNITGCKVNHLTNPLGYAMHKCVFSWVVEGAKGKRQTAARIQICQEGNTVTDTGWGDLDSLATEVAVSLLPQTRYTWTVSVRTDAGEEATSEENWFETGLRRWTTAWIGCEEEARHPIFSKNITPRGQVRCARLYICGLGLYETRYNGEKIGEEYLTPYCNNYNAWLQYQTYDITTQLQNPGTLSVELGNGWYQGRFGFDRNPKPYYGDGLKLTAQVHLVYADGTEEVIPTNESWQVTRSNIFFSNIYDGEQRDDTLPPVAPVAARMVKSPRGRLMPRYSTPVTVQEVLPVKELIQTPAGESVLDVGQNMTGSFRLSVHEPAGTKIHLQFGEILQQGNFYRDNLRSAKAEYIYISDGQPHVLEPKFTFYGFRYVKVQGVSNLKAEDFQALVLHSQIPQTGTLTTGHVLVNQLISNIQWGQKGNFLDVPTDCPQRDERMGWTGDAQVFAPTACYQRDCYAFYAKYLHDMATEQETNHGAVPDMIPSFGKTSCSAAWGDAACIIPMVLYDFYGDKTILEAQYGSMVGWAAFLQKTEEEDHGWLRHFHYGDWLALDGTEGMDSPEGGTEKAFVAGCCYVRTMELTARAARILGQEQDAARWENAGEKMREYLQKEYITPNGRCAVTTQTGYVLAYRNGINPNRARAQEELVQKLKRDDGILQTGFVGTPLFCPTLTEMGAADMAFNLLLYEGYPGWLYAVKLGATTIWERWNSVDETGKIAENGMNSLNHYAYGSVAQWLYEDVLGIAPAAPGFRKGRLMPHLSVELEKVEGQYASAAGLWKAGWEILPNGDVSYHCTVPFDCTAELILPYGGGNHTLQAGDFALTYTPDTPLRVVYSTRMPIGELLQVPRVKAALIRMMPQIVQLPASMQGMSMRTLAAKMGSSMPEEMFDKLDAVLANL